MIIKNISDAVDQKILHLNDLPCFFDAEKSKNINPMIFYYLLFKTKDENYYELFKNALKKENLSFPDIFKLNDAHLECLLDFIKLKNENPKEKLSTCKSLIGESDLFLSKLAKKTYIVLFEKKIFSISEYKKHPEKNTLNRFIESKSTHALRKLNNSNEFNFYYDEWKQYEKIKNSPELNYRVKKKSQKNKRINKSKGNKLKSKRGETKCIDDNQVTILNSQPSQKIDNKIKHKINYMVRSNKKSETENIPIILENRVDENPTHEYSTEEELLPSLEKEKKSFGFVSALLKPQSNKKINDKRKSVEKGIESILPPLDISLDLFEFSDDETDDESVNKFIEDLNRKRDKIWSNYLNPKARVVNPSIVRSKKNKLNKENLLTTDKNYIDEDLNYGYLAEEDFLSDLDNECDLSDQADDLYLSSSDLLKPNLDKKIIDKKTHGRKKIESIQPPDFPLEQFELTDEETDNELETLVKNLKHGYSTEESFSPSQKKEKKSFDLSPALDDDSDSDVLTDKGYDFPLLSSALLTPKSDKKTICKKIKSKINNIKQPKKKHKISNHQESLENSKRIISNEPYGLFSAKKRQDISQKSKSIVLAQRSLNEAEEQVELTSLSQNSIIDIGAKQKNEKKSLISKKTIIDIRTSNIALVRFSLWTGIIGTSIGLIIAPKDYLIVICFSIGGMILGLLIGKSIDYGRWYLNKDAKPLPSNERYDDPISKQNVI